MFGQWLPTFRLVIGGEGSFPGGGSLSPLRGLLIFRDVLTACAVGCIFSPLRGWSDWLCLIRVNPCKSVATKFLFIAQGLGGEDAGG